MHSEINKSNEDEVNFATEKKCFFFFHLLFIFTLNPI